MCLWMETINIGKIQKTFLCSKILILIAGSHAEFLWSNAN